ncbi:MAG: P1 family peptidase [Pikeienuella sp.]
MTPGPRNLITDVPGLVVGNAADHHIKTGTTVLTGHEPFTCGVHVMGGAPGTRETDVLSADRDAPQVDALVLSGGSAFGLDAASGVMDALASAGRGHQVGLGANTTRVPIVPAAILFDLLNGGDKNWGTQSPYRQLGTEALRNADADFTLGTSGAGVGATTAGLKGGLGSASLVLETGATVGALVAVNAIGSVAAENGCFWAANHEQDQEYGGRGPCPAPTLAELTRYKVAPHLGQNTTIAIVATDAALTQPQATRIAVSAHDGMARAITPAHTSFDGDLVFAAATGTHGPVDRLEAALIGHAAALCLTRAIARAIYEATAAPNDIFPAWKDSFGS